LEPSTFKCRIPGKAKQRVFISRASVYLMSSNIYRASFAFRRSWRSRFCTGAGNWTVST
jgi:hypothetical protein